MKAIRVTVILDGLIKECRVFEVNDIVQMRDYSFALLDMQAEYGEIAIYRIEEA